MLPEDYQLIQVYWYMVQQEGFDMVPYLDDMDTAEVWELAYECYDTMRRTVKNSGAEESTGKNVSPALVMIFLGILDKTKPSHAV